MGACCSGIQKELDYTVDGMSDLTDYTVKLKHNDRKINFTKIWRHIMDIDMKNKSDNPDYKPIFLSQVDILNRKVCDVHRKGEKMPYQITVSQSEEFFKGKRESQFKKADDENRVQEILSTFRIHKEVDKTKFTFAKGSKLEILVWIDQPSHSRLITNISPIYNSHCLYVPFVDKQLPQFIANKEIVLDMLKFAYQTVEEEVEWFIGYNSVGAQSSINNIHFQVLDVEAMRKDAFDQSEPQTRLDCYYGEWLVKTAQNITNIDDKYKDQFIINEERSLDNIRCIDINPGQYTVYKCRILTIKDVARLDEFASVAYDHLAELHARQQPYNLFLYSKSLVIIPRIHQVLEGRPGRACLEFFGAYVYRCSDEEFRQRLKDGLDVTEWLERANTTCVGF